MQDEHLGNSPWEHLLVGSREIQVSKQNKAGRERQKPSHRGENPREESFKKEIPVNHFKYYLEVEEIESRRNIHWLWQ